MADKERELVARTVTDDADAFCEVITTYKRLVYHIVVRMLPNPSDHEDICQDVFVKVYQNLKKFNFESKLSTWIATITHNTCINFLKKKQIPLTEDLNNEKMPNEHLMTNFNLPSRSAERDDLQQRLNQAIACLPVQYRNILTLYHLEEMSYSEIAGITGLPGGTVKSHLFRARKLLKENLLAKYQKEELWL